MKEIKMVDLHSQYIKIKTEVDKAIQSVINTTSFINGDEVKLFKKELSDYLQVKHVIPCANGTDALQIALMALNLQPGDEIITPNFTFIATVEVAKLLQLVPVLVDVDPYTFNIIPEKIEQAITQKTKAIIPVHLFGQCADMEKIIKIANKHNLVIIEDCAQAISSKYCFKNGEVKFAGTMGHIGCTSFFPSKNLGCFGDGGAIYTNDDNLASRFQTIVNHGMKIRYYYEDIGVNSRLDTIQAAILRIKLKYLDEYNSKRILAADFYDNYFKDCDKIITPAKSSFTTHIYHQYTIQVKNSNRDKLREYLEANGIPAMIYYPVPLHLQKAYYDTRYKKNDFPVTEMLCREVLSLPMHSELDHEQLEFICRHVLYYVNNN